MTDNDIIEIIKMRFAVYSVGVKNGTWKDLYSSGTIEMMEYIYPKTGQLAFYQLLMEQMRMVHNTLTGGVYYLFKMPVQIEKEISEYLRKGECNIKELVPDHKEYLRAMDTIPTDHSFSCVNIGTFSIQNITNLLRLCASHYLFSFENNVPSYPFFE